MALGGGQTEVSPWDARRRGGYIWAEARGCGCEGPRTGCGCRRGPSVIDRPSGQDKPIGPKGDAGLVGKGLTADVLYWGPNPHGGGKMASRPEMIGNLVLSVTRFWEFMAGAGVEPTTIPKEGDPLSGIHGRKTSLRHPPPCANALSLLDIPPELIVTIIFYGIPLAPMILSHARGHVASCAMYVTTPPYAISSRWSALA